MYERGAWARLGSVAGFLDNAVVDIRDGEVGVGLIDAFCARPGDG